MQMIIEIKENKKSFILNCLLMLYFRLIEGLYPFMTRASANKMLLLIALINTVFNIFFRIKNWLMIFHLGETNPFILLE